MNDIATSPRTSIFYLSHGGGPLPLLGDAGHRKMVDTLQAVAATLNKPSAIIVFSAHWEERKATITSGAHPALIYDYYGFPEESYDIEYPAPGHPELARKVFSRLKDNYIDAVLDDNRGFDHGLFIPLKIMYPQADISCIQVSLVKGLDPMTHINIGEALAGLELETLLVIGSGFSFHNMKAFFTPDTNESQAQNASFEDWLIDTCSNPDLDENERTSRLVNWEKTPAARYCHPREEHLLPLHVCYGLAKRPCREVFELTILGKKASMYLW